MQSNPELPGRDKLSKTMKYVTLLDLYFKVDKLCEEDNGDTDEADNLRDAFNDIFYTLSNKEPFEISKIILDLVDMLRGIVGAQYIKFVTVINLRFNLIIETYNGNYDKALLSGEKMDTIYETLSSEELDKLKPIMVYIDSFLNNHLDKL